MGEYEALQEREMRGARARYQDLANRLYTGMSSRGMYRSGIMTEGEKRLGGQEAGEIADIKAGITDKLLNYRMQQEQLALMRAQLKAQKPKKKKFGGLLGPILGAAGMIGGAFLGPVAAGVGGSIGQTAGGAIGG